MYVANFTVAVTIGHKFRTGVVAIDIWGTDFDTGRWVGSRRMVLGDGVRRKTVETYGEVVNNLKR